MIGAELIAELDESSYNLNTSPYTVNLQGDLYDYHFIVFCDSGSTTNGDLLVTLNADTGSNYERYLMNGVTSTASASVSTSQSNLNLEAFTRNQSSRNALAMGVLTGSSGDKRKISCKQSSGYSPRIYICDGYWTNTADEATSITFTGSVSASYKWHIMLYRVPKESAQGSWEYMKELSWSSETAEKSFTVDGDTDIQYMLDFSFDNSTPFLQCNNDGGSNYPRERLLNNNGTIQAQANTSTYMSADGKQGYYIVNAESGVDRLVYSSASQTTAGQQEEHAYWWQNTADNLTSLDMALNVSGTGTCKLYRKINPNTTSDPLPFETIKVFDVSGDYSAGDTLSGLSLDGCKMVKIEWLGSCSATGGTEIRMQFNADTGSNYTYQFLNAVNSTTSAATGTIQYLVLSAGGDASEMRHGVAYIYPKSGEYRPVLNKQMQDEDQIVFYADWWLNSANEITSIKCFASNTNSMSGQIKISVLRDHNFGAMTASSLLLNGSTQYTLCAVDASLSFGGTSTISIDGWFYADSSGNGTFRTLIRQDGGYYIRLTSGNQLYWKVYGSADLTQSGTFPTNQWVHILCTYDGTNLKYYQNGTLNKTQACTGNMPTVSEEVAVGRTSGTFGEYWLGSIGPVGIYRASYGADDATALYNGGIAKQPWLLDSTYKTDSELLLPLNSETDSNQYSDYSGNANDATAYGSPTITGEDITIISGPDPSP